MIDRILKLDLPEGQSTFLWAPRQTGKTTLLKQRFPTSIRYDLLQTDLFLDLSRNPSLLRQQLLAATDEALARPIVVKLGR
jgi:predicted AAA+ superfamily ATPase